MTTPFSPQAVPAHPLPGLMPAQALIGAARRLRDAAALGQARGLLRGKNIGLLCEAMECQGLAPALVQQLQRDAGVPVFGGLGELGHPIDALSQAWATQEPSMAPESARRYLLQAALVQAIG